MRTIKFRAWDKYREKMLYNGFTLTVQSFKYEWRTIADPQKDSLVMMQSTGLHDKNGKEIYEGDILTFTEVDEDSAFGREETHTGEVGWIDEFAKWMFIYPSGQRRELHLVTNFEPVYDVKVIGNIMEHPHLLTQKQP